LDGEAEGERRKGEAGGLPAPLTLYDISHHPLVPLYLSLSLKTQNEEPISHEHLPVSPRYTLIVGM